MNKQYLNYLIRTRKVLILFFLAVCLCVSLTWNLSGADIMPGYGFYSACKAAGAISIALTYLLPVLVFAFVHKRSSADVFFALPVSRKEQRITSLIFAFGISFGYFLITVVVAWILYGMRYVSLIRILLILVYGAFMVITLLAINSALFLLGNNFIDGIVMMGAYTMFPLFASVIETQIVFNLVAGGYSQSNDLLFLLSSPVMMLGQNLGAMLSMNGWLYRHFSVMSLIFCAVYLVIAWIALQKEFDERQTERAEQISDHPLSYPLVINLYAILFLLLFGSYLVKEPGPELIVMYVFLLVCYVTAGFLYRRKLKVDAKTIGIYAAEAVLCAALMFAMWKTHGFGMADRYSLNEGNGIVYDYSMRAMKEDLGKVYEFTDPDDYTDLYVSFQLNIDAENINENNPMLARMEGYRKEAINAFYAKQNDTEGYFQAYTVSKTGEYEMSYNYQPAAPLTEADLNEISRYTDVIVTIFNDPSIKDGEYKLDEFLKLRNKK